MQKDVIYIDTEDDITAIIGKVRASQHKIVALVPPKRIGAIQSAVNLKLVHRAADQAGKNLVLISSNTALMALAGSTGIPVAKNLQSKPEVAEVPALDIDGEDVIDGNDMPTPKEETIEQAAAAAEGMEQTKPVAPQRAQKAALGGAATSAVRNSTPRGGKAKVPNFDTFRKKLFIIIAAAILLIGFLVWAIVFAPAARITVTARTSDSSLSTQVKVGDALITSLKEGSVKSITKTTKNDAEAELTATGSKNVGEKATGTIKFSTSSSSGATIPAGTKFTVSGMSFLLDSAVTVPAATLSFGCGGICPGTASGSITASEGGTDFNGASGAASGAPAGVSASLQGSTSGGTDKTATVVKQSDVDTAKEQLFTTADADQAKAALAKEFGDDYVVIEGSFAADTSDVKATPAVDEEAANGKATLKGTATYSLLAVSKSELGKFLDEYFKQQIDGQDNQKVYDNGIKDVTFTNVNKTDDGFTAGITTNGKVGPKIEEDSLKEYAKGRRLGEIQDYVKKINGVADVDIKFSPFWVNKAPNNADKIRIEFKVND